jgi:hypothetical protein
MNFPDPVPPPPEPKWYQKLWYNIKRERAVLIGLLGSVLMAIQSGIADGTVKRWQDAIPLLVGIITRFFVTPTNDPRPD